MSFDFNPISNNLSNVQASSKTSDGGAGNTGYFKREQKEENMLEFTKDYPEDSFEYISLEDIQQEKDESFLKFLKRLYVRFLALILYKIKKTFKKKK